MRARRLRPVAAVLAAALATVVSGCGTGVGAVDETPVHPTATSTWSASPTAAPTSPSAAAPADLTRFYDQQLHWHSCGSQFQCTSLTVPVDYSHPSGSTLQLAVIRQDRTSGMTGSLVVNPGGPGASGVQFVREAADGFAPLTSQLDLVSFDPRGVGASHPIECLSSSQLDRYIGTDPDPTTPAELSELVTQAKAFAAACAARNGSFLDHDSTIDEARDMDVLRAALREGKLTYYGASYGTYLGAMYASLFPTHIRAMVLDGAVDPTESATAANGVQAQGFQTDLGDFAAACASAGCGLGSSRSAVLAEIRTLQHRVTADPETVGSRELDAGQFFEGLAAGLYSPDEWTELAQALTDVRAGHGATLLEFADSLDGRSPDGHYSNLVAANTAINCVDRPYPRSLSAYTAAAKSFEKQSPDFGAAIEFGSLPCAYWPAPPVGPEKPVNAVGAPPIVVIGTTRDPATPYVWAQALSRQLHSGVLLTYEGDGHTAYLRGDRCIDDAVDGYLLDLHVPSAGTRCS